MQRHSHKRQQRTSLVLIVALALAIFLINIATFLSVWRDLLSPPHAIEYSDPFEAQLQAQGFVDDELYIEDSVFNKALADHMGAFAIPSEITPIQVTPPDQLLTDFEWPYCSIEQFNQGRWEQTRPVAADPYELLSQNQYTMRFPNLVGNNGAYCGLNLLHYRSDKKKWIGDKEGVSEAGDKVEMIRAGQQIEFKRAATLASYDWIIDECQLAPWNAENFVEYLVRTEGGMIIVGDSLSEQHSQSLAGRIGHIVKAKKTSRWSVMYNRNVTESKTFYLTNGTPFLQTLSTRLGQETGRDPDMVRLDLLKKPIIRYIRNDYLLTLAEYKHIVRGLGRITKAPEPVADFWQPIADNFVIPGLMPITDYQTLIVLNTGPHWRRDEFGTLSKASILTAYERMATLVSRKLRNPTTPMPTYSHILYRSTTPGHASCNAFDEPALSIDTVPVPMVHRRINKKQTVIVPADLNRDVPNPDEIVLSTIPLNLTDLPWSQERASLEQDSIANLETPSRVWMTSQYKFNWDWFVTFNLIWRQAIEQEEPIPNRRFTYLDVYRHAALRPDAHVDPWKQDCLHFCLPGVPDYWSDLIRTIQMQ